MPVLVFQFVVTGLLVTFGAVSLLVARRGEFSPRFRAPWMLTGLAFLLVGTIKGIQNTFGSAAFATGRNSALWESYLAWAPIFDHSRTVALTTFFLLLLRAPTPSDRMPGRGYWVRDATLLCLGALAGAALGWQQQFIADLLHYEVVAILDTAELIVVLSVLFVSLLRNSTDRILWSALSVYGFILALNGLWMSVLVGLRVPGAWAPSPLHMHFFRSVLATVLVALALWRLSLARRNVDVAGLLEPAGVRGVSSPR